MEMAFEGRKGERFKSSGCHVPRNTFCHLAKFRKLEKQMQNGILFPDFLYEGRITPKNLLENIKGIRPMESNRRKSMEITRHMIYYSTKKCSCQ